MARIGLKQLLAALRALGAWGKPNQAIRAPWTRNRAGFVPFSAQIAQNDEP